MKIKTKMDKIFEKKQIGRPCGSYEDKRKAYYDMVSNGKIKQPKNETLAFYKINFDEGSKTYALLDLD